MKEMFTKITVVGNEFKVGWDKLCCWAGSFMRGLGGKALNRPVRCEKAKDKEYALVTLVEKAHRDWEEAQVLFNEVKEPDLIDHAIFAIEATERKYMFLLKEAKRERAINEEIGRFVNS